jgi:dTDP-4-dehydrorhamnose 3,5-epimerase
MSIRRTTLADERGFLARIYSASEFAALGFPAIAQINHTFTAKKGAVRGLHYQLPPHAENKVVNCIRGEVFDVAVDLRRGSPTFLQWHAEIISRENGCSLLIPEGCAHGFQALTENCELVYLHSAAYHAEAECALNAADPRLAIAWPLAIAQMSGRDRAHPMLSAAFDGIAL